MTCNGFTLTEGWAFVAFLILFIVPIAVLLLMYMHGYWTPEQTLLRAQVKAAQKVIRGGMAPNVQYRVRNGRLTRVHTALSNRDGGIPMATWEDDE